MPTRCRASTLRRRPRAGARGPSSCRTGCASGHARLFDTYEIDRRERDSGVGHRERDRRVEDAAPYPQRLVERAHHVTSGHRAAPRVSSQSYGEFGNLAESQTTTEAEQLNVEREPALARPGQDLFEAA